MGVGWLREATGPEYTGFIGQAGREDPLQTPRQMFLHKLASSKLNTEFTQLSGTCDDRGPGPEYRSI